MSKESNSEDDSENVIPSPIQVAEKGFERAEFETPEPQRQYLASLHDQYKEINVVIQELRVKISKDKSDQTEILEKRLTDLEEEKDRIQVKIKKIEEGMNTTDERSKNTETKTERKLSIFEQKLITIQEKTDDIATLKTDVLELGEHLKTEMSGSKNAATELKAEMKAEMTSLREIAASSKAEMKTELTSLRESTASLKVEMKSIGLDLQTELQGMGQNMAQQNSSKQLEAEKETAEMKAEITSLRESMANLIAVMKDEMASLTKSTASLKVEINTMHQDLQTEVHGIRKDMSQLSTMKSDSTRQKDLFTSQSVLHQKPAIDVEPFQPPNRPRRRYSDTELPLLDEVQKQKKHHTRPQSMKQPKGRQGVATFGSIDELQMLRSTIDETKYTKVKKPEN